MKIFYKIKHMQNAAKYKIYEPLQNSQKKEFSDIQKRIIALKEKRNAVILAHNYVCNEIQEVADFTGDSLGLSRKAKQVDADVIAFAGVDFMAETAKILNPTKTVVIPDRGAGCSLEELCESHKLAELKAQHPNALVISYINCSAQVKALSDLICTSGNALDLVRQIPADREIIFCPDKHLGSWIEEKLGRKMILWDGFCQSHIMFDKTALLEAKASFPDAPLISHPECPKPVRDISDCVCSTEKMISFCREDKAERFIIATVEAMIFRLRREVPNKTFIAAPAKTGMSLQCRNMNMNTPEKLLNCLETLKPEIKLPADLIEKSLKPIEKMLEMSKA